MEKKSLFKNESNRENDVIDLLALAKALWHRAWVIVITSVLLAAIAGSYAMFLITPMYSSSVLMYVNNSDISVGNTSFSLSDLSAAQSLVDTYLVILNTRSTLEDVIEDTGLDYDYEQLESMISSSAVNSTEIFKVTVTSAKPEDCAVLANSIAKILPDKIASIVDGSSVRVVENAIVENDKVSPSISRYAMMGFLIGFVLSCGLFVVLFLMDDTISDETYLLETFNAPVLAAVPDLNEKKSRKGYYGSYGYGYSRASSSGKHGSNEKSSKKE